MRISMYQVDAFTSELFKGNPAAVCPLTEWLPEATLQAIASENNLSETAFFVPEGEGYRLRWFTPRDEVDLCGHATLATAHVIFTHLGATEHTLRFDTRSGPLFVSKLDSGYRMNFPAAMPEPFEASSALLEGLGVTPTEVHAAFDIVVVLENEQQVRTLAPELSHWHGLGKRGVVVTAPGDHVDFVSRAFFPELDVPEDPVTGSAHCELAPYWAERLGKTTLTAHQVSERLGELTCVVEGERVGLVGQAVDYFEAVVTLPDAR
ncbi:PhzF family phenazine biosynthesis protein [Larsenimonas suaedae]|uniref:PhzF family phenazine biosynthesis protein n=1 Tax=Larsenimonas suaedae TaxID=1851019 RepID=A0ABU1GTX3_9GAMM|nr:PhzF family phenazine biosynthesis protein [Larsenimonas suaedae]MCM2971926.1 PhzF family phenazine biosynthesis protein [Larsenimonas suaedae]MDR5895478.1 PhzF family phenazine biosynthesis protein [Larsenimonas suaedae]